jgi:hypothetical protein
MEDGCPVPDMQSNVPCELPADKQGQNAIKDCGEGTGACEKDDRGNVVYMEVLDEEGRIDELRVMKYDACGNLRSSVFAHINGSDFESTTGNGVQGHPLKTTYEYDDSGTYVRQTVHYGETLASETQIEQDEASLPR